jgi:hypothetical protein
MILCSVFFNVSYRGIALWMGKLYKLNKQLKLWKIIQGEIIISPNY